MCFGTLALREATCHARSLPTLKSPHRKDCSQSLVNGIGCDLSWGLLSAASHVSGPPYLSVHNRAHRTAPSASGRNPERGPPNQALPQLDPHNGEQRKTVLGQSSVLPGENIKATSESKELFWSPASSASFLYCGCVRQPWILEAKIQLFSLGNKFKTLGNKLLFPPASLSSKHQVKEEREHHQK